jgi:hypothetical protein
MTKAESEALFIDAVQSDETRIVEMTVQDTNSFRVHVHRIMKEMESKNHTMWLKAKSFGVSRVGGRTVISKALLSKFKVYRIDESGKEELVKYTDESYAAVNGDEQEYVVDDLGAVDVKDTTLKVATSSAACCRYCIDKVCVVKQAYMRECDKAGKNIMEELKMVVCDKCEMPKIIL